MRERVRYPAARLLLAAGLIAPIGLGVNEARDHIGSVNPVEIARKTLAPETYLDCYGKPIEGQEGNLFVTELTGDYTEIPVKTEPSLNDELEVGLAILGQTVQARQYCGFTYASGQENLGKVETPNKPSYGIWYRIQGIKVFDRHNPEKIRAEQNVFVSGNFLRLATEQEKSEFYTSSE